MLQEITWMSGKAGFHFDLITLLGVTEIKLSSMSLKYKHLRSWTILILQFFALTQSQPSYLDNCFTLQEAFSKFKKS